MACCKHFAKHMVLGAAASLLATSVLQAETHSPPPYVWQSVAIGGAGCAFTQLDETGRSIAFSFGRAAPGRDNPSLFVYGVVNDELGVFLSDDFGDSWQTISVPAVGLADVSVIVGDMQTYGRVYVGDGGRGIWVGEPIPEPGSMLLLMPGTLALLSRRRSSSGGGFSQQRTSSRSL